MTSIVCYLPSYNNSEHVLDSLASVVDLPVVVVDNASDPAHRERLQSVATRGTLVQNETNLGRVGNWHYCVEHFLSGDATWLKWLFAGDRLLPDAGETLRRAMAKHPSARLIGSAYFEVYSGRRELQSLYSQDRLFAPADALREAIREGNWYGPPSAVCVHREAVQSGFDFGQLPFAADAWFCTEIAARLPSLYSREPFSEFHSEKRAYFQKYVRTMPAFCEGGLMRAHAADLLEKLAAGTRAESAQILEAWLRKDVLDHTKLRSLMAYVAQRTRKSLLRYIH